MESVASLPSFESNTTTESFPVPVLSAKLPVNFELYIRNVSLPSPNATVRWLKFFCVMRTISSPPPRLMLTLPRVPGSRVIAGR